MPNAGRLDGCGVKASRQPPDRRNGQGYVIGPCRALPTAVPHRVPRIAPPVAGAAQGVSSLVTFSGAAGTDRWSVRGFATVIELNFRMEEAMAYVFDAAY